MLLRCLSSVVLQDRRDLLKEWQELEVKGRERAAMAIVVPGSWQILLLVNHTVVGFLDLP
jgi:hypothetical protein